MKSFYFFTILIFFSFSEKNEKEVVSKTIDDWHLAAAKADFESYFSLMSENSVFIGTAPNERWNKDEFMKFSKPYFDGGKAWDFKVIKRTITFSKDGKTAWFDEVLDTWMKDCSGSGVLEKIKGKWKISFYDLHVLIENEKMDFFLKLRNNE